MQLLSVQREQVAVTISMSPKDYVQARESGVVSCIIDNKPYFPNLKVLGSDTASILAAVAATTRTASCSDDDDDDDDVSMIEQIQGGNTNKLYRVGRYLVRIFGAEGMIDRDVENAVYASLSYQGLAPPYYGRFANGRVEGWLHMRPLTVQELPLYYKTIAAAIGIMHSTFQLPPSLKEHHHNNNTPALWTQLQSWMDQALLVQQDQLNLADLPDQLEWLQRDVIPTDAAIAFCHNDLLAANILTSDEASDMNIQLIDFEYGSINYIAFDIANHFNEYAGGTDTGVPQYDWLPTEQQQKAFIQEYLQHSTLSSQGSSSTEDMYRQVQAFVLVNHLYWGLWAVNQAAMEGCDRFDYLLYATHRIGQYRKLVDAKNNHSV
jgi:ethanolamine kinase